MGIYFIPAGGDSNRDKTLDRGFEIDDLCEYLNLKETELLKEHFSEKEKVYAWGAKKNSLSQVKNNDYVVDIKNEYVIQVFSFCFCIENNTDLQEFFEWNDQYKYIFFLKNPTPTTITDKSYFQYSFKYDNKNWLPRQKYLDGNRVNEALEYTSSLTFEEFLGIKEVKPDYFSFDWLIDHMNEFSEYYLKSNEVSPILFSTNEVLQFKFFKEKHCFKIRSEVPASDIIIFEYKSKRAIFRISIQESCYSAEIDKLFKEMKDYGICFSPFYIEKASPSRIHPYYRSFDLKLSSYPFDNNIKKHLKAFILNVYSIISEIPAPQVTSYEKLNKKFEREIKKSQNDTSDERKKRLNNAAKKPCQNYSLVPRYNRNPDVIAEVLFQAAGICANCKNPAPFKRVKDGSPYLEVHHKIPLADGGEDTVANAEALCPNCHAKKHYGN